MGQAFIHIGGSNLVNAERLLAITAADSSPARRMIQEARDRGALIDASSGRRTRAVLVMDSDHVICSACSPEELELELSRCSAVGGVRDLPQTAGKGVRI